MGTEEKRGLAANLPAHDGVSVFEQSKEDAYYGMLYQRLDGLLKELSDSGMASDDKLLERLRHLKVEAGNFVNRQR